MTTAAEIAPAKNVPTKSPKPTLWRRKTTDWFSVQSRYENEWEEVTGSYLRYEARANLKEYRQNEPGVSHRLKTVRESVSEMTASDRAIWEAKTGYRIAVPYFHTQRKEGKKWVELNGSFDYHTAESLCAAQLNRQPEALYRFVTTYLAVSDLDDKLARQYQHETTPGASPMNVWFNVYDVDGRLIDEVHYPSTDTPEDVKRSLVNHDGYDADITVECTIEQHPEPAEAD